MTSTTRDYIAVTETHPNSPRPLMVGCVGTRAECEAFLARLATTPAGVYAHWRYHGSYDVEPTAGRRSSANVALSVGDRVTRMIGDRS